jgi:hypothetical protein
MNATGFASLAVTVGAAGVETAIRSRARTVA